MKKFIFSALVFTVFSIAASAQAEKRFPGISAQQLQQLRTAKRVTAIPLPTWIPAGFKIKKLDMKLGAKVPVYDRQLVIIYSRSLPNGKTQRFAFEAGFDGIGDLPYDTTSTVKSGVGVIDIAYQPPDLDEGSKKLKDFVMTQWFTVGKTAFHYDGMYGAEPDDASLAMISLAETRKILGSLQRF
jgi:hypothetical protein